MSQLTGTQKAALIDALLSGYTSDEELAELLDLHLDVKLAQIAQDGNLREQVFAVVTWAEARGRTKELALAAQKNRAGNEALGAFVDALYPGERTRPAGERTPPAGERTKPSERRPPESKSEPRTFGALIYGAVAVAALLIVVIVIALRSWGGSDNGKDRQRLPVTLRFTELSAVDDGQKVVVDARFPPPQLTPGDVVWFVVGSGQRCRDRVHRAQVDTPSLGYMTSVIKAQRAKVTCAQLFVEDANGQAIARSDPRDITFHGR
jgi:hypothetical protein